MGMVKSHKLISKHNRPKPGKSHTYNCTNSNSTVENGIQKAKYERQKKNKYSKQKVFRFYGQLKSHQAT